MDAVTRRGTARGARLAFGGGRLLLGAKTGTGDNRRRKLDRSGRVTAEEVRSRTAAVVFTAGQRWYGVITAHVEGPSAAQHRFTSALPTRILALLGPRVLTAFGPSAATPRGGSRAGR